ncbi:20153_t:CDS:2 [Funneliformis geosporum]|nr:20153_t:CDS:2 [Funneliformis geosporum]
MSKVRLSTKYAQRFMKIEPRVVQDFIINTVKNNFKKNYKVNYSPEELSKIVDIMPLPGDNIIFKLLVEVVSAIQFRGLV